MTTNTPTPTTLASLVGTTWRGKAELWLIPSGNEAEVSQCCLRVEPGAVCYEWARGDDAHQGSVKVGEDTAVFTDTFHAAEPMTMAVVKEGWALVNLKGTYGGGGGPEWGWRIAVCLRPQAVGDGQLVLQMTNITPWGEEGRAVRMVCDRVDS